MTFNLKKDMLLGVASSATQIEGGELGHSWNDWYHSGRIRDGSNPARANDHYNRWKEDADLMADMGIKIYRMGVEWARLCPTENKVDQAAIERYREELSYLRGKGISVLLTIHHFTNPIWFEKKGGFTRPENIKYFLDFVSLVTRSFGDLVSRFITINEPNVYATQSYYFGLWPPGEKSFTKAVKVMSVMAACHIMAYEMIHKIRREMGYRDTMVSFAHHMRVFNPLDPKNPKHRLNTKLMKYYFQEALIHAMYFGNFKWPLKRVMPTEPGEYCDFIGLNYYTRTTVSKFEDGTRKDALKNDLGWEIYPKGIVKCANKLYSLIKRPIYITENGTCDNNDSFRCRYIYDHLKALCESGLPIERYYHWCFCDNFEWREGERARFGLVYVDYDSQERTLKKSARFYSDIIRSRAVTQEMYDKYVKEQEYHK